MIQDKALDDIPIISQSAVQEDCGQKGFHRIGQNGGTAASAAGIFPFAQFQIIPQIQGLGHQHQAVFADQIGANAGEIPLWEVGERAVEVFRHNHSENGVSQKFQPLVAADAAQVVLIGVGAVGQGVVQQGGILEMVS